MYVDLRTRVPEKLLRLDNQTRTVQATNNNENLRVYLYFSQPILNSSSEILSSLNTSKGILVPIDGESLLNRRFGFTVCYATMFDLCLPLYIYELYIPNGATDEWAVIISLIT